MEAKLVTYRTEKLNNSEKSQLSKKLNGYTDKSHHGEYTYHREGLLGKTRYVKVYKNTFIIAREDWPLIKEELEKKKATIKIWNIILKNPEVLEE